MLILQEDSCLVKIYASFDCGFCFLNPFVNSNIKRVIDENCTLSQYVMI